MIDEMYQLTERFAIVRWKVSEFSVQCGEAGRMMKPGSASFGQQDFHFFSDGKVQLLCLIFNGAL
jgi:hypothetical protein